MIEIERKRVLINGAEEALRMRLAGLRYYCPAQTTAETDVYYSRPDVNFMTTVECLRVRQRDGFGEITFKPASTIETHSADDIIAKRETNVTLAARQTGNANDLLRLIGMRELVRVTKVRTLYRHPERNDIVVAIDQITGLGTFVEVEVTSIDHQAANTLLAKIERQLGVDELRIVTLPYRDLMLEAAR
ncbi:class IV adenylate cyclase [Saccharopolyspora sp. NPDC003752]